MTITWQNHSSEPKQSEPRRDTESFVEWALRIIEQAVENNKKSQGS